MLELQSVVKKCMDMVGEEHDSFDKLEDLHLLLDGDDEICRMKPTEMSEYGFWKASDLVNERLGEFFDICDEARIWVTLYNEER